MSVIAWWAVTICVLFVIMAALLALTWKWPDD